jgi:hypothetical protein
MYLKQRLLDSAHDENLHDPPAQEWMRTARGGRKMARISLKILQQRFILTDSGDGRVNVKKRIL